jgi:divalent metal cation (Fe/Co/Zn/Cd) transporter
VLGLAFAIAALGLASATGDGRWDGIGSAAIGLVLVGVAIFLATEVSSLLLGERADPDIEIVAREVARTIPEMEKVLNVLTMQQGPGEVLVHIKIAFTATITIEDACCAINVFEERLRKARPEIRWVFAEPDIPKTPSQLHPKPKAALQHEADA